MLTTVNSIILQGLKGVIIKVEVDSSPGIPSWEVIGLPDTSIKEAKERVRRAIQNSGIQLKSKKYIINLSPANIRKEGANFDLAIAVGVLENLGIINSSKINKTLFIGELSLTGKLNKVLGVLPMCIEAQKNGIEKVFLPIQNQKEGSVVEGLKVYGVKSLNEIIEMLNKEEKYSKIQVKKEEIFEEEDQYSIDYSDVKGQEYVKRALEVCAAGGHNCLLIGNPGSRENNACRAIYYNTARYKL